MAESFASSSTLTGPTRPPTAPAHPDPLPVAFRTLGCKVNQVESEDIAADLLGRGVRIVPEHEAAVVVINTCTVTAEADRKARKAVRHALAHSKEPVIVVTGCLAVIDPVALESLDPRVVVEPDKESVADRVAELVGAADAPHSHAVRAGAGFHTRAMLKVEDGCDNFCTYCIVPYARGVPRSVPLARLVAEAAGLVDAGVPEIVVTGINVGRYRDRSGAPGGTDTGDVDLADLIVALGETGVGRVRLSSIEPPDLTPRLLHAIAATPAFCPHLHVPLQSGSDRVLEEMGRGYSIAEYEERIADARDAIPGLAVTTDVLVGFPGETDYQAEETRAMCERIGFAKLHVFRYSRRPGTPAAARPDQVGPETVAARAAALRDTGDALRAAWLDAHLGTVHELLVERVGSTYAEGTTPDYAKVRIGAAASISEGARVPVRLTSRTNELLLGEIEA